MGSILGSPYFGKLPFLSARSAVAWLLSSCRDVSSDAVALSLQIKPTCCPNLYEPYLVCPRHLSTTLEVLDPKTLNNYRKTLVTETLDSRSLTPFAASCEVATAPDGNRPHSPFESGCLLTPLRWIERALVLSFQV